jgi:REP element-mobilizing transposase RayT
MRHARIKIDHQDSWYHCYNRAVGTRQDRPFDDVDKERFVQILHRIGEFYSVRIVAYQVMSNHFHLLVQVPAQPLDPNEVCRRYKAFHKGKRELDPDSALCREWQARLRDISWFMRHLQQMVTRWFNRTRPIQRRGPLWADRFKHTVLEDGEAVWGCWNYIENNAARAGMVQDAADYRFCSHGIWHQTGRHPFEATLSAHVLPMLKDHFGLADLREIRNRMDEELAQRADRDNTAAGPTLEVRRPVRYWVDGLVIGSEQFVRTTMSRYRTFEKLNRHRVAPMENPARLPLCSWRRLRLDTA